MNRFIISILSGMFFFFSLSGWAQEGKVIFAMEHELNPGFEAMASMIPTETRVFFNPTKVREEQESVLPGDQFTIIDQITGESLICLEINGKKYQLITPPETLSPEIKKTGNSKVIAGLPCEETQIINGTDTSLAFITHALPASYNPLAKGHGFVMAFSTKTPQGIIHYSANQVVFEPIDSSMFEVPDEYQKVTPFELQKILSGQSTDKFEISKTIEDLNLTDIKGDSFNLAGLNADAYVLNFWFAACKPCVQEIPQLNELTKQFPDANVAYLAITFDAPKVAETFVSNHPFDFRICPGSSEAVRKLGIVSFPSSIVLDKELNVVGYKIGSSLRIAEELAEIINQALND